MLSFANRLTSMLLWLSFGNCLDKKRLISMLVQDHDGSHIKGLLINFIHSYWPSLLKVPSFLIEFITPIVKVGSFCSLIQC